MEKFGTRMGTAFIFAPAEVTSYNRYDVKIRKGERVKIESVRQFFGFTYINNYLP